MPAQPFSPLPVPSWQLNKPLSLATVAKVTDAYLASLQPARKLKLPVVPEAVKKSLSSFAASLGQPSKGSAVTDMVTAALADQAVVEEGGKVLPGFTVSFLTSLEPKSTWVHVGLLALLAFSGVHPVCTPCYTD